MNQILEAYQHLNKLLTEHEVVMQNGKTFPISLTLYFIEQKRYNKLQEHCEKVLEAIEIFTNVYIEDKQIQQKFPELNNIRELSCALPHYKKLLQYARFDLIEDQNGNFKILEPNCACPGGILLTPTIKINIP